MKLLNFIESFINRALACFALIVFSFSVIGSILDVQFLGKGLAVSQLLDFFFFSVLLSLSVEISKLFKKNAVLRGAVRFVLTFAAFILVFFFGNSFSEYLSQKQNPAFSVVVLSFAYVIIYVVCSLFGLAYRALKGRISNSAKEYQNVYADKQ